MTGNLTIVDKKTQFGTFRCEERIKSSQFRENIDYTFDEIKGIYTLLSHKLRKDILIIQNPYNENIDVSDLVIKVLVDYREEINIKPQIVIDLERREGLIEAKRGINDYPLFLPTSNRIQEIKDGKIEVVGDVKEGQDLVKNIKERKRSFELVSLTNIDTRKTSEYLVHKSAKYNKKGRLVNRPEMHSKEDFSEEQWSEVKRVVNDNGQSIDTLISESRDDNFQHPSQYNLMITEKFLSQQKLSKPSNNNNVIVGAVVFAFSAIVGGTFYVLKLKKGIN